MKSQIDGQLRREQAKQQAGEMHPCQLQEPVGRTAIPCQDFEAHQENAVTIGSNVQKPAEIERVSIGYVLMAIITCILNGFNISQRIFKIRQTKDPKMKSLLKRDLPWFSGALFQSSRSNSNIIQTNFIILDIDHVDKPEELKAKAIEQLHRSLKCAFRSPGDGVKLLFGLSQPIIDNSYKAVFRYLSADATAKLGVTIDKNASSRSQACFLSYDPLLIMNPRFVPLAVEEAAAAIKTAESMAKAEKRTPLTSTCNARAIDPWEYENEIDLATELSKHLIIQGYIEYGDWVKYGMALKATFGNAGRSLFLMFADNPYYNDSIEQLSMMWDSFNNIHNLSFGSLLFIAEKYGW